MKDKWPTESWCAYRWKGKWGHMHICTEAVGHALPHVCDCGEKKG